MSLDVKKELLAAVQMNLNIPGLSDALIDKVAMPALQNAVAASENKIDDVVVAALAPLLANEIKKLIRAEWGKVFESEEPVL